jgi:hypothetical protein
MIEGRAIWGHMTEVSKRLPEEMSIEMFATLWLEHFLWLVVGQQLSKVWYMTLFSPNTQQI